MKTTESIEICRSEVQEVSAPLLFLVPEEHNGEIVVPPQYFIPTPDLKDPAQVQ